MQLKYNIAWLQLGGGGAALPYPTSDNSESKYPRFSYYYFIPEADVYTVRQIRYFNTN